MKRVLALCVLAFSGCDWAGAEQKARCARGDTVACDGGGLPDSGPNPGDAGVDGGEGSPDAGPSDAGGDGGADADASVDAGALDASVDAGSTNPHRPIATRRDVVGLFPRDDAGTAWLVVREGELRIVEADGGVTVTSLEFTGRVIDAYGDGVMLPWLAVIVDGFSRQVAAVDQSNQSSLAPTTASWASTFVGGGHGYISLWSNDAGSYRQDFVGLTGMSLGSFSDSCDFRFFDLQVLRANEGDRVVLAYASDAGCEQAGSAGLVPPSGLATITNSGGVRAQLANGRHVRVGRNEGGPPGLVAAEVSGDETQVDVTTFSWTGTSLDAGFTRHLICDAGLTLGDVSGELVSGVAYGPIGLVSDGFPLGVPTAFVASVALSGRWVAALGPTQVGAHVPVLRVGDRVLVAWMGPGDAGVQFAQLNALDGGR